MSHPDFSPFIKHHIDMPGVIEDDYNLTEEEKRTHKWCDCCERLYPNDDVFETDGGHYCKYCRFIKGPELLGKLLNKKDGTTFKLFIQDCWINHGLGYNFGDPYGELGFVCI